MSPRIPLPDVGSLSRSGRRTRAHWAVLALALAALVGAVFVLTRPRSSPVDSLVSSGSTVVVIDLSGSTRDASKRIAAALLGLTRDGSRRLGLVVFSDTGYEALPLETPADALRGWLTLLAHGTPGAYPWTPSFSGGTVISTGLAVARRMLSARPPGDRHVLLVSDLVDGIVDLPKLQSVVAQYQREEIDLRVISVQPATSDSQSNASFLQLPNAGFVGQAAVQTIGPARLQPPRRTSTTLLVLLVAAAGALAAAYEALLHPLTWRRA
jgi:hypothetical protein